MRRLHCFRLPEYEACIGLSAFVNTKLCGDFRKALVCHAQCKATIGLHCLVQLLEVELFACNGQTGSLTWSDSLNDSICST